MKIKTFQILSLGCLTATMMLAGACKKVDEPKSSAEWSIKISNLYIPDDESKEVTFQTGCQYGFQLDYVNNTISITGQGFNIGGNSVNFSISPFKMDWLKSENGWTAFFGNGSTSGGGLHIDNLGGFLTNMVNYHSVDGEVMVDEVITPQPLLSYKAGEYTVKTFAPNAYFTGITTTRYPSAGGMKTFQNPDMIYRVSFAKDMKKADVVIYKACFAEEMLNKGISFQLYLFGLDVELSKTGYKVSGTGIVPEMLGSGTTTPNPGFPFDKFEISTVDGDMSKVKCEYTVKGIYEGSFSGVSVHTVGE